MEVKTYASYNQIHDINLLKGHVAIVIEAMNGTSSMITALKNDATCIYPVSQIYRAMELKKYYPQAKLAGNENDYMIEGFDLSASPRDFQYNVYAKQIIFVSDCANALEKCENASVCIVASLLNVDSVINFCKNARLPVAIVLTGKDSVFALEDGIIAGAIAYKLRNTYKIDDLGTVCTDIFYEYQKNEKFYDAFLKGSHTQRIISKGFYEDVEFCSKYNIFDLVPIYKEGVLSL